MSPPDPAAGAAAALASLPGEGPVFPAPWAARAFALAVALNEREVFTWGEWSECLGAALAHPGPESSEPQAYWRAWLAALEQMLAGKGLSAPDELRALGEAWRRAAATTPHGRPVTLAAGSGE